MKSTIKVLSIIAVAAVIVFTMACKGKNSESSGSAASSTDETQIAAPAGPSSADANSIDSFLANYEKFTAEYAVLMQKVLGGDYSAAGELEKYTEVMEQWTEQLQKFSPSDYTSEQLEKLMEISTKLAESLTL